MPRAAYINHPLHFHRPAGTSRGVLNHKPCWFVALTGEDGMSGIGEVSFVPGLSLEDGDELEIRLDHVCKLITRGELDPASPIPSLPGVQFALETALRDLHQGGTRVLHPSAFTNGKQGIPTNGLIWMGDRSFMLEQIGVKIEQGFRVLKMKVGALGFEEEMQILARIREEYGAGDLEIRLDANGAWEPGDALEKMERLSSFGIHSLEQPIAAGQWGAMAEICRDGAIAVALDEELIGISTPEEKENLLRTVAPRYVILKPGLLGGVSVAESWISEAGKSGIGWWATSALESNIGLNAIAQWVYHHGVDMPQGLGTGQLFSNNIPSPLRMEGERLWHLSDHEWDLRAMQSIL